MQNYYYSIASGSKGNCGLLHIGTQNFIIDLGVSHRKLKGILADLGLTFADIAAVLITHEHVDHVKGVQTLCKKESVPVYATNGTAEAMRYKYELAPGRISAYYGAETLEIAGVRIHTFLTPHDAVESVGFVFVDASGERFGYATDLGFVPSEVRRALSGCSFVVLESNHDLQMLAEGDYPYPLKERIRGAHGHLSNVDCARFAVELVQNGTKQMVLAHLSEQNNMPSVTLRQTTDALALHCLTCDVVVAPVDAMQKPLFWEI